MIGYTENISWFTEIIFCSRKCVIQILNCTVMRDIKVWGMESQGYHIKYMWNTRHVILSHIFNIKLWPWVMVINIKLLILFILLMTWEISNLDFHSKSYIGVNQLSGFFSINNQNWPEDLWIVVVSILTVLSGSIVYSE